MSDYVMFHKKSRSQSRSRSLRRKRLREIYGKDWKEHEFRLSMVK